MSEDKTDEPAADTAPPAKPPNRVLAIAIAAVAIGCLGSATFTDHWLASPQFQVHFGLRVMTRCGGPRCETIGNDEFVSAMRGLQGLGEHAAPSVFAPTGWVTFVACLVAIAGLLAALVLAATRKRPTLPITPTTIALLAIMVALVAGCVFVATNPDPVGVIGLSYSFYVFAAGCLLGIVGAQLLAKVNRPPDPDLLEDAMNPEQF